MIRSKIIIANLLNMLTALVMLLGYALIAIPAGSYFHAYAALFSIQITMAFTLFNLLACFVMLLGNKFRMVFVTTFIISVCILFFELKVLYPWSRYSIHFPSPQGVCWRENALFYVGDSLKYFTREKQQTIPTQDDWKEMLVKNGYDFENTFQMWEGSFESSILLNENVKGMDFEKLDPATVLLFEGPKGDSFGNEDTFGQFALENKYIYVVLVNGQSGRVRPSKDSAQSLFGGLNSNDMPLKWKPAAAD